MLDIEIIRYLDRLMEHADVVKKFLIVLRQEESVNVAKLTPVAGRSVHLLGKLRLVQLDVVPHEGARAAFVSLTPLGHDYVQLRQSQWADELAEIKEEEGEDEPVTKAEEWEQFNHLRKKFNEWLDKEKNDDDT